MQINAFAGIAVIKLKTKCFSLEFQIKSLAASNIVIVMQ